MSVSQIAVKSRGKNVTSRYIDGVVEHVKTKNPGEPEFHQAVLEVLTPLVAVLERLTERSERESTDDYAEDMNRDFRFSWTDAEGIYFSVTVYAYVRSDSPTCRKVVVGEDRVESVRPRYAILCD